MAGADGPAARGGAAAASPGPSKLAFLTQLAINVFQQPGEPTSGQIDALRRTLSLVPLEELGLAPHLQQQEVDSSSSSRSSSPGLHGDGLLASELAACAPPAGAPPGRRQRQAPREQQEEDEEGGGAGSEGADAPRPPITYLLIYENELVSLGIFCLPARAKIPLHNHPGMTVLSRVLYGDMHITSYDWLDGQRGGQGGRGGGAPRPARTVLDASLSAADAPAVLFPAAGGNIHEFTALTDCAVLDLMSPPYSTEDGRDCTYYCVHAAPEGAPPGSVLLGTYEPPPDFVINQGHYRGVQPRPKALPLRFANGGAAAAAAAALAAGGEQLSLSPPAARGEVGMAAAGEAAAGAGGKAGVAGSPPGPSPVATPPISSPTAGGGSDATGAKLSSLLGSGGGGEHGAGVGVADCAASGAAGWHEQC